MCTQTRTSLVIFAMLGLLTGCPSGDSGLVGPAPIPSNVPRFVYAAEWSGGVSVYAINAATGRIKYVDNFAAGTNPASISVDPTNSHAYVANAGSDDVSAYSIDSANGMLTQIKCIGTPTTCTGDNFAVINQPRSLTVDPSGRYLYVANTGSTGANAGNTVSQFNIATNGSLTPMNPATVTSGTGPQSVTVDPSGKHAYVANTGSNSISAYAIQPGTGLLSRINCVSASGCIGGVDFAAGSSPWSVTVDPMGKYAYVANSLSNNISQYRIEADGSLAPMSPPTVASGTQPRSITVDPSGKYLYVANYNSQDVWQYKIGANGGLQQMNPAVVLAGTSPWNVTVDRGGKLAYVANYGSNNISEYTINEDPASIHPVGGLIPNAPLVIASRGGPSSLAIGHGTSAVSAVPKYAYVVNSGSDSVSQFAIEPLNGSLSEIGITPASTGVSPRSIAVDPSGKYAYVANFSDDDVAQYTIESGGSLKAMPTPTIPAGNGPSYISVDPSGKYVFVINALDATGNVSQYTIKPDGSLAPNATATVTAGQGPLSMTIDPSGRYAYVTNFIGNSISQFTILSSGTLSPMVPPTVTGLNRPYSIAIDPSGGNAYVADYAGNELLHYAVNPDGSLGSSPDAVTAGTGPHAVTIDPTGQHVFVASEGTNDPLATNPVASRVFAFAKNATTGVLSPINDLAAGNKSYSVAVEPSGKFVYVVNIQGSDLWQYAVESDGSLTYRNTKATGSAPFSVTTVGTYQ